MQLINLTPHAIDIHTPSGVVTVNPFGIEARADEIRSPSGVIWTGERELGGSSADGIAIGTVTVHYGPVRGLPGPSRDIRFIVSSIAFAAAQQHGRTTEDLLVPIDLIRDGSGRMIGCRLLGRPVPAPKETVYREAYRAATLPRVVGHIPVDFDGVRIGTVDEYEAGLWGATALRADGTVAGACGPFSSQELAAAWVMSAALRREETGTTVGASSGAAAGPGETP